MHKHEIPTHLEVEDRILGSLTTRDALYLLVGAAAAYGFGTEPALAQPWRLGLAASSAVLACFFALVRLDGRPLDSWLYATVAFIATPRVATWRSRGGDERGAALSPVRWQVRRPRVRWLSRRHHHRRAPARTEV